ncbi:MAG: hypothetical protein ACI9VI_001758 [Candidatus Azotimanducaceae bacterium]|jgi:hypothetical protein
MRSPENNLPQSDLPTRKLLAENYAIIKQQSAVIDKKSGIIAEQKQRIIVLE